MKTPKKEIVIGLSIVGVTLLVILFYFIGANSVPDFTGENDLLKKQKEKLEQSIFEKDHFIENLQKKYSGLLTAKADLEAQYKSLEKQKVVKIIDYRKMKPDDRATAFLSATQKRPVIRFPTFSGDSLLVPISNVDSAMVLIIEESFCDQVIMVKDSLIENAESRITYMNQIIDLERGKFKDQKEIIEGMEFRNEQTLLIVERLEKKLKWVKLKSTIKDVAIVGGIILLII